MTNMMQVCKKSIEPEYSSQILVLLKAKTDLRGLVLRVANRVVDMAYNL